MATGIEYEVRVIDHATYTMRRGGADTLVDTMLWMIESLPTEMARAEARVGLMLQLRHTDDEHTVEGR